MPRTLTQERRFFLLPLLLLLTVAPACVRRDKPLLPSVGRDYRLGESHVLTLMHQRAGSSLLFFNMHDDENTAVRAALRVIRREGGRVLELRHGGKRLVEFEQLGAHLVFDPNRIFTDEGARASLEHYGDFTREGFQDVRRFAEDILRRFPFDESSVMLTVHNNGEGEYSLLSYEPGAIYAGDAARIHRQPGTDPDDFFFVTDDFFYTALSARGFNVVLQNNQGATDDGSLSVLAAQRGIPYINVEAQHGHLGRQVRMLRAVYAILREWRP